MIGSVHSGLLGEAPGEGTIIGMCDKTSAYGAFFANAELINALDCDAITPPDHVAPYVVPRALALGECLRGTRSRLVAAIAVADQPEMAGT
jgi:hypothetical protein